MGSSKKHKKHKSERREKYEGQLSGYGGIYIHIETYMCIFFSTEYSNNMDPSQLQRGLKLILKVGPNNTPEYSGGSGGSECIPLTSSLLVGPPTAAEAMCSSPLMLEDLEEYRNEKHKKSKKKKKKKDREKKHKHHKEKKRDKSERHTSAISPRREASSIESAEDLTLIVNQDSQSLSATFHSQRSPKFGSVGPPSNVMVVSAEGDSSQDDFSFMDDTSQPLPENILFYAGMTTENSPSCRPVSKPIVPRKCDDIMLGSPASSSLQSLSLGTNIGASNLGIGSLSPTKPLSDVSEVKVDIESKKFTKHFLLLLS